MAAEIGKDGGKGPGADKQPAHHGGRLGGQEDGFLGLLPGQRPIRSYDSFVESQRKYFENPNSSFEYRIVQTEESGDLGFGVSENRVKLEPKEDKFTTLQICFLFRKVNGSWKLIFNQNSVLPK